MEGYYTNNGYMGYVHGEGYRIFDNENAYYEWKLEAYPELYSYHEGGEYV